jgi:hypothetical protein
VQLLELHKRAIKRRLLSTAIENDMKEIALAAAAERLLQSHWRPPTLRLRHRGVINHFGNNLTCHESVMQGMLVGGRKVRNLHRMPSLKFDLCERPQSISLWATRERV